MNTPDIELNTLPSPSLSRCSSGWIIDLTADRRHLRLIFTIFFLQLHAQDN